jgi:hypothetical protein
VALLHQEQQLALAHHGVGQGQARELDLLRPVLQRSAVLDEPVVELSVVLELQGADRVGDAFDGVRQGVGEVVERVEAPGVAGGLVAGVANAVERRIPHLHVGRGHVDLGPQRIFAVGELAGLHPSEEIQVLFDAALAPGALLARFGDGAAAFPHLFFGEVTDVGLAVGDQVDRDVVDASEVVGGVVKALLPVEAQPAHVVLDRVDVLLVLLQRVGVVHPQVADAAELLGDAEVQADRLGVADVEVAVGLGWEAGHDPAPVFAGLEIRLDELADEVGGGCRCGSVFALCRHAPTRPPGAPGFKALGVSIWEGHGEGLSLGRRPVSGSHSDSRVPR